MVTKATNFINGTKEEKLNMIGEKLGEVTEVVATAAVARGVTKAVGKIGAVVKGTSKVEVTIPKEIGSSLEAETKAEIAVDIQGLNNPGNLQLKDFTKELLDNKPKYACDVIKWYKKGGIISVNEKGVWTYHDWEGNLVSYPDGYPDFKSAGMVIQEVQIGEFESYPKDFSIADELAPNGPKADEDTWHHHQDGTTMQEIDKGLHRRFTHIGGMSDVK